MEELPQSIVHSLHVWEDSIKKMDEDLKQKPEPNADMRPPVRGSSKGTTSVTNTIRFEDFGPLPDGKKLVEAVSWKEKGNALFGQKKYKEAIDAYSKSIELDPDNAIYWSNRALAHLNLSNYKATVDDCTKAIHLDDTNVKAYLRRSTAYRALNSPALALIDLQRAGSLEPSNKQITKDLDEVKKTLSTITPIPVQPIQPTQPTTQAPPTLTEKATKSAPPVTEPEPDFLLKPATAKITSNSTLTATSTSTPTPTPTPTTSILIRPPSSEAKKPVAKNVNAIPPRVFNIKPRVPSSPPTTAYQFETTWRELKSDTSLLYTYIKMIDSKDYASLFKDALSSPILSSFLLVAKRCCEVDSDFTGAKNILYGLLTVPRIDMLFMLMSSEEQEELVSLVDRLSTASLIDAEETEQVKKKFKQI